jgi:hypothetical protein
MHLLVLFASLFPFDPAVDSAMAHRHLIAGYCITWAVHLAYLSYLVLRLRALSRR